MMNRIIRRRHIPRTSQVGNPANPQIASTAAITARMRMVIAHENIGRLREGLKHAKSGALI
jgi:hypothetical protein